MREFPLAEFYEFERPTLRDIINMRRANMDCIFIRIVKIGNPIHQPVIDRFGELMTPNMAIIYSLN